MTHNTMARSAGAVARRLEKTLQAYNPQDGECVSLSVMKDALPGHRWDLYLLGLNANNKAGSVMRTMPLIGRTQHRNRVVVLVSSLREWLMHYNPGKPETVEGMIKDLRQAERQYRARLEQLRAEMALKEGTAPGRKPRPKPAKQVKPPKFQNTELMGVWR